MALSSHHPAFTVCACMSEHVSKYVSKYVNICICVFVIPSILELCQRISQRVWESVRSEVSDSLPMFQPHFSDDCSPLPRLIGSHIFFWWCSLWQRFNLIRGWKDRAGGLLAGNVCVCVSWCLSVCVATESRRVRTKQYPLAYINECADSRLLRVPQVQRAEGAFQKGIFLFDIQFIA